MEILHFNFADSSNINFSFQEPKLTIVRKFSLAIYINMRKQLIQILV